MHDDPMNPEDCPRSLAAEALQWAPHRSLFLESLGLMAVANVQRACVCCGGQHGQ
jgi:hypothetical protein